MPGKTRSEPSSQTLAIEQIDSAPFQIRQSIEEERLRALASSIEERGLLQPIVVRPKGDRFEVVMGECRLRAAKLLRWSTIACRVSERSDLDAEIDKIVESEQQTDPKPLERARAFAHLRDEFHLEQDEIAKLVGVHKSVVSRTLALLKQPAEIQKLVADESISPRHLRSLESIDDESKRVELAEQAAKEHLTSDETRRRARESAKSPSAKASDAASASAPPEISHEIEPSAALRSAAKTPVRIQQTDGGDGSTRSTVVSPEPIAAPPAQIPKTSIADGTSPVDSAEAILEAPKSVAPSEAPSAPAEIERRAPEPAERRPAQRIEEKIGNWCIALGTALRGPARTAVWEFYERMTEVATWWRLIKAGLKFLARFIPGREPEPTKMQKAIMSLREITRRPRAEAAGEAKKPDSNPPKVA